MSCQIQLFSKEKRDKHPTPTQKKGPTPRERPKLFTVFNIKIFKKQKIARHQHHHQLIDISVHCALAGKRSDQCPSIGPLWKVKRQLQTCQCNTPHKQRAPPTQVDGGLWSGHCKVCRNEQMKAEQVVTACYHATTPDCSASYSIIPPHLSHQFKLTLQTKSVSSHTDFVALSTHFQLVLETMKG